MKLGARILTGGASSRMGFDKAAGAAFADLHFPFVIGLGALPAGAGAGWPVARLIERAGLARVVARPEARARLRGANTPADRETLLEDLRTLQGD